MCSRCRKTYYVDVDGNYVREEECDFHWGRLWKKRSKFIKNLIYFCGFLNTIKIFYFINVSLFLLYLLNLCSNL